MTRTKGSPKASIHQLNGAKRIGRNVYDQATTAYLEEPSERHVAKACTISRETARRLIREGHTKLGLPPIAERARSIHREAAKAEDYDLIQAHRETLRALRGYKTRFLERFTSADVAESDVCLAQLEKLAKLESFLCGGAEQRVAVSAESRHIENMSPQERLRVIELAREAVLLEMAETASV